MAIGESVATWFEGRWHKDNRPIVRAADHAAWLGSQVFDGARQFEGVRPDLEAHCARIIRSAGDMGMAAPVDVESLLALIEEGCSMFATGEALYLRPMMWARESTPGVIDFEPENTGFAICIETLPMPSTEGFSLTLSPYRRPHPLAALTLVKTGSLYANNARIMADARRRGFSNALSLDFEGHVAETASTNVFLVRDGAVFTPVPNDTFLAGITRRRVIALLRADGVEVQETSLTVEDFRTADEIFCTGNIAKVMPVSRFEDRDMNTGGGGNRMARRARELYWDFAMSRMAA
jgi:branched-chain amino acid aminotransferase